MYRNYYSFSTPKPYLVQETTKKFAEDIECIIKSGNPDAGSLYISNIEAASNPATLKSMSIDNSEFRIGAVLSCAKGYQLSHSPSLIPHYKYIPTEDHDKCDISIHFDEAVDFISEKLRKTNVKIETFRFWCIALQESADRSAWYSLTSYENTTCVMMMPINLWRQNAE